MASHILAAGFVVAVVWGIRNLFAGQIWERYLNPWKGYYYFRFVKTNSKQTATILGFYFLFTIIWVALGWFAPQSHQVLSICIHAGKST